MGARVPIAAMPAVGGELKAYFATFGEASASEVVPWIVQRHQNRLRGAAIPGQEEETEYLVSLVPKAVSYWGIVKWFYIMRQLKIIEYSRSEPAHGFPKNFYRVVTGKEDEIEAGLPYLLYPSNVWGGKRYKRASQERRLQLGRSKALGPADAQGKWAERGALTSVGGTTFKRGSARKMPEARLEPG